MDTNDKPQAQVNFAAIAKPLIDRGFRITPVHPETKMCVMRNWQNWQISAVEQLDKYTTGAYAHHNVGVVGKRGVDRHCFLDIDEPAEIARIEQETGHRMPVTYTVQSRPVTEPNKQHFYFIQSQYSFQQFGLLAKGASAWESKNINRRDTTKIVLSKKGNRIHPTLYDMKGIGGGSIVVGAGSVRGDTGETYTAIDPAAEVVEIPDWLVGWLVQDFKKYREAVSKELKHKHAARQKAIQARLKDKTAPAGCSICEEDIYWFARSRAGSMTGLGFSADFILAGLADLIKLHCENGDSWVRNHTDTLSELAHSFLKDDSPLAPDDWYKRMSQKQLQATDPFDENLVLHPSPLSKKQLRDERLADVVHGLGITATRDEVNSKVEQAFADPDIGIIYNPKKNKNHRKWVSQAMRAEGFDYSKALQCWYRKGKKL